MKLKPGFFCSEWQTLTFFNPQQASNNLDVVSKYSESTEGFCKSHDKSLRLNLAACRTMINKAIRKLEKCKEVRSLVPQLTTT
jgi:hypothetical protein